MKSKRRDYKKNLNSKKQKRKKDKWKRGKDKEMKL